MYNHRSLVTQLLGVDPFSAEAARLRIEIGRMERNDPALITEYLEIMIAHSRPIGEAWPAETMPEGVMLT